MYQWILLVFALSTSACVGVIGDEELNCGDSCDDRLGVAAGVPDWRGDFVGHVDREVELAEKGDPVPMSITGDQSTAACVATWTVGGAIVGEAASKTCMVVGVATAETGVGAIAAAVCVAADFTQADIALGAAAGYLSGYAVCNGAEFISYVSGFRVFNWRTEQDDEAGSGTEIEEWNTPECRARYDEYKAVCRQPRSCRSQLTSCEEFIENYSTGIRCAEMRNSHMFECPHPDNYNWDTHQDEVGEAYRVAQECQTNLCQSNCLDLIDPGYYPAYEQICS